MAEEINDILDENDDKKTSKPLIVLVVILIVLIWLAILALVVKLDVGGFGSNVLRPILKDVPVVNLILPDPTDDEIIADSKYKFGSMAEALARIEQLENEVLAYKEAAAENAEVIANLSAEVARLTPFETYQANYIRLKKEFDEQVVFGNDYIGNYAADPETYIKWYEELDPENAAILYEMALERRAITQVIKDLAETYAKMKPSAAATILEEMTGDEEKVAHILSAMSTANAAQILNNMDPTYAAKITLLIYPSPYTMDEYLENRKQEQQGNFPVGNPDGTHGGR